MPPSRDSAFKPTAAAVVALTAAVFGAVLGAGVAYLILPRRGGYGVAQKESQSRALEDGPDPARSLLRPHIPPPSPSEAFAFSLSRSELLRLRALYLSSSQSVSYSNSTPFVAVRGLVSRSPELIAAQVKARGRCSG